MRVDSRTFCFVSQGKVPVDVSVAIRDSVSASVGERLKLTLAKDRASKTSTKNQREYYFPAIVSEFQRHFSEQGVWYDTDVLHDAMMKEIGNFRIERINPITGEKDNNGRRSYNDLSTGETEDYHTKCRVWAAENGFDVKEPNEGI